MQNNELVLVADFGSDVEAQAAHGLLKSAGIPSFLKSSAQSMKQPNWAHTGEFGNLLLVPKPFLADAKELLTSRVSEIDLIRAAEAAQDSGDQEDGE